VCLPRIEEIAEKNRKGDGGKDAAGDELLRQTAQRSETRDQEQVGKSAEEKAEETIEVARNKPARPGSIERWRRASDGQDLAS
jgi:hypothetical protein